MAYCKLNNKFMFIRKSSSKATKSGVICSNWLQSYKHLIFKKVLKLEKAKEII